MTAKYARLIGWALGDVPVRISTCGDIDLAVRGLRSAIKPVGPTKLQLPMYFPGKDKCEGYIKNGKIILIAPGKWYGVSTMFSLDRIFYFNGYISKKDNCINGKFQLLLFFRHFLFFFYIIMTVILIFIFSLGIRFVFDDGNFESVSGVGVAFIFILLFYCILFFMVRLGVHFTSRSRNVIKELLMGIFGNSDGVKLS